jgi:hypothetical protein
MGNKINIFLPYLFIIVTGCTNHPQDIGNSLANNIEILNDTRELVMQATEPWESHAIGYYKVIKISDIL